jgi:hypothetical protein
MLRSGIVRRRRRSEIAKYYSIPDIKKLGPLIELKSYILEFLYNYSQV